MLRKIGHEKRGREIISSSFTIRKGWKHLGGSLVYKPSSVFDGHLSKSIVTVLILAVFLKNLASN